MMWRWETSILTDPMSMHQAGTRLRQLGRLILVSLCSSVEVWFKSIIGNVIWTFPARKLEKPYTILLFPFYQKQGIQVYLP